MGMRALLSFGLSNVAKGYCTFKNGNGSDVMKQKVQKVELWPRSSTMYVFSIHYSRAIRIEYSHPRLLATTHRHGTRTGSRHRTHLVHQHHPICLIHNIHVHLVLMVCMSVRGHVVVVHLIVPGPVCASASSPSSS